MPMTYTSVPYFTLDPHAEANDGSNLIPINDIAKAAYGKSFDSLRACQRDHDNVGNDAVVEYRMGEDMTFEDSLGNFDSTSVYLGFDARAMKGVTVEGVREIDYWKSITWLEAGHGKETVSPEDVALYTHLSETKDPVFMTSPYMLERWEKYLNGEAILVEVNPPETKDLTNAVFAEEFYAQRAFSPSLGSVIADLIRRGDLPRGNYLFRHWW